jgi:GntR family transcriptional regulator/MocR family aminotransferase
MTYPGLGGHRPLREAIARYLTLSRGIACSAEQVLVTGGYQSALDLVVRVVLRAGDEVWFEEPGYHVARKALEATAARLVPVRVDGEGLRVADGIARSARARLAVVTPAHQSPLGVSLSLARRLALLAWAAEHGGWILEDDYDGEFHYAGRPLPALKSIDRAQRVLYAGSFSKVLYPGLRLGYLVVPVELQPAFLAASRLRDAGQATFGQAVVASFMEEGHFVRHLKRMRMLYAERRGALAEALGQVFGDRMAIEMPAGGLHLLADLPGKVCDMELARRAHDAGLSPPALSAFSMTRPRREGLLLGFTNIPESQALRLSRQLERALFQVSA